MSVKLAMVAVNKSVLTQLDHLSVRVMQALICHLVVSTVIVRWFSYINPCNNPWFLKLWISMSVRLTMEAANKSVPTQMDRLSAHVIRVIACHLITLIALVSD